jgi:hypothetical protein
MEASAMTVNGNLSAQWTALVPKMLRPLVYPLLIRFPSPDLQRLNVGRARLAALGMALVKNAMARLGQEWVDEIGMEETCREWGARQQPRAPRAPGHPGRPWAVPAFGPRPKLTRPLGACRGAGVFRGGVGAGARRARALA